MNKKFRQDRSVIEEQLRKIRKTLDVIYGENPKQEKSKAVRLSISLPENDVNYVSYLRSIIANPNNNFYPTISDIYRAGINSLKKLEEDFGKEKILELIKD